MAQPLWRQIRSAYITELVICRVKEGSTQQGQTPAQGHRLQACLQGLVRQDISNQQSAAWSNTQASATAAYSSPCCLPEKARLQHATSSCTYRAMRLRCIPCSMHARYWYQAVRVMRSTFLKKLTLPQFMILSHAVNLHVLRGDSALCIKLPRLSRSTRVPHVC